VAALHRGTPGSLTTVSIPLLSSGIKIPALKGQVCGKGRKVAVRNAGGEGAIEEEKMQWRGGEKQWGV